MPGVPDPRRGDFLPRPETDILRAGKRFLRRRSDGDSELAPEEYGASMVEAGHILLVAMLASASSPEKAPSIRSASDFGSKWGVVTSVFRSPEHNRLVGGVPNSFHLSGQAVDIARRPGVRHSEIEAAFRKAGYLLIESLDEGDHSHFAFELHKGAGPASPSKRKPDVQAASCPAGQPALEGRRRPDRFDECTDPTATALTSAPLRWANEQPGSRAGS
jgi:hypothetical protein